MYRAVIKDALRDLAYGSKTDAADVVTWLCSGESFSSVCTLANWDEAWLRDVFEATLRIEGDVRKPVVKECLSIMRTIIRLTPRDRYTSPPVVLHGQALNTIADEGGVPYADTPIGQRPRRNRGQEGETA